MFSHTPFLDLGLASDTHLPPMELPLQHLSAVTALLSASSAKAKRVAAAAKDEAAGAAARE